MTRSTGAPTPSQSCPTTFNDTGSFRIKGSVKSVKSGIAVQTHVKALRYFSGNRNVATVSASGKVRATGTGTCRIYVLANNVVRASIKVKVK